MTIKEFKVFLAYLALLERARREDRVARLTDAVVEDAEPQEMHN